MPENLVFQNELLCKRCGSPVDNWEFAPRESRQEFSFPDSSVTKVLAPTPGIRVIGCCTGGCQYEVDIDTSNPKLISQQMPFTEGLHYVKDKPDVLED